jgi:hypothetical protein
VSLHQNALGLVDDTPGLQRGLQVVGLVPGTQVGVQVAGGDRGVGTEPRGRRPAGLVEGVRPAGIDVHCSGDLLVVDGQRDREGSQGTSLCGPRHVVRPSAVGARVGDLGQLAGEGSVKARTVAALVLPLVEVSGQLAGGGGRGRVVPDQQGHRRLGVAGQHGLCHFGDVLKQVFHRDLAQGQRAEALQRLNNGSW